MRKRSEEAKAKAKAYRLTEEYKAKRKAYLKIYKLNNT